MIEPRHRWVFPEPIRLPPDFREAASLNGLGPFAAAIIARRRLADASSLGRFLGPATDSLNDPRLLPDSDVVLERLRVARARGERVLVFGDFDADGLTGLAILVLALRRLGIEARPYVPSRLEEGHGLSLAAVASAAAEGIGLIVTVDTGSSSVPEIQAARAGGIDVIVTDHHRVPDPAPPALALVNPHRADATYPDRGLSGSGVAFTVARLLLDGLGSEGPGALDLVDLAAIGTVSDVAPILGENRAIARLGLARLRTDARPGIAALLARAGVEPASIDLETIGFVLAPRLNAAGRVGDALDAARLLLADSTAEAVVLAATLEAANTTRRDLMRTALDAARAALGLAGAAEPPEADERPTPGAGATAAPDDAIIAGPRDAAALVVRGPWPVGIIGLIAGRLADETGRPTVVMTALGDVLRGSCRGDGRVHLAATLAGCEDLLLRHGGHAAAAGFELPVDRWPAFLDRFTALAEAGVPPDDPRRPLAVDLALPAAYVDYGLARDLARLAPHGPGNPDPLVAVLGLTVQRRRAATGGHTQLVLRREVDVLDAIAFGRADLATDLDEGDRVDVVARLTSRAFGGVESLQLEVRDVARSGSHPRAAEVLAHAAGRAPGVRVGPDSGVPARSVT